MRILTHFTIILLSATLLAACESTSQKKLTGERVYILEQQNILKPDPALASVDVKIPPPTNNPAWPAAGGYPDHVMGHLSLGGSLAKIWGNTIGKSTGRSSQLSQPVMADNQIVTMDADARVTAFDATSGQQLWQVSLRPDGETHSMNAGGVAHGGTIVFASTGYAEVVAIDSTSGAILWRQRLNAPIRSAPTVSNGRVFVVTMENELFALSVADGSRQWSHAGFDETLTIAGGASPAVSNNVVVAAYSSGELVGLRADNGRVLWSENLGSLQIRTGASGLADIIGHPVIDRDMVFAISHNRRMVAIDTRTGRRVWSQPISSLQTPWVAGHYIYVLTSDAQILCLTRETGQIVWVTQLDAFEKPNDRRNPIVWTGPVLGGDRLIVTSSTRIAMSVSPYTGKILGEIKLPNTLAASPIIANSTLYLLTERGQLLAFR